MRDRIEVRYATLRNQIADAQQQYAALEAELKALDRQLLAMFGGLHELEGLMSDGTAERVSPYETGLNGVHEATLEGDPI